MPIDPSRHARSVAGVVLAVWVPLFLIIPPRAWLGMALAAAGVAIANRPPPQR